MDALLDRCRQLFDPSHGPGHRNRLIGGAQLVLSASLLALILMVYALRPSAGATTVAVQSDPSETTWASLAHDARAVSMSIRSAELEEVPAAIQERWVSSIDSLTTELAAATPVVDMGTAVIDAHVVALSTLVDRPTDLTPSKAAPVLGDLIDDLDLMASAERAAEVARLESETSSAIVEIGWRMLGIAVTAVATAIGLVGLGTGLDRMSSSERSGVVAVRSRPGRERQLAFR